MAGKQIPLDGAIVNVDGTFVIVYDLGHGVKVFYDFSEASGGPSQYDFGGKGYINVSGKDFYAGNGMGWSPTTRMVHGGMAAELTSYGPSYQQWFQKQIDTFAGGRDWVNDPEIRGIYANFIANQDKISQQEVQSQIKTTNWWKTRTAGQAAYNDLSPADQTRLNGEQAAQLVEQWFRFTGENISIADGRIRDWAHQIASGAVTAGVIIEQHIKPHALQNQQSPWSRTLREEGEAQRQDAVDIDGQTELARSLFQRWGIQGNDEAFASWGTRLANKEASPEDLLNQLRQQAQVLYPWKDPNMETATAVEPWLQTYSRVLERSAPSMFDPKVQKALVAGTPLYQFEQELRTSPEWLTTKNAMESLTSVGAQISRQMGYS